MDKPKLKGHSYVQQLTICAPIQFISLSGLLQTSVGIVNCFRCVPFNSIEHANTHYQILQSTHETKLPMVQNNLAYTTRKNICHVYYKNAGS